MQNESEKRLARIREILDYVEQRTLVSDKIMAYEITIQELEEIYSLSKYGEVLEEF